MSNERSYTWKQTHEEYIPYEVSRMVDALGLDETVENMARSVHEQAIEDDYEMLDADALATAAVFAATRLQGAGVSMDEMVDISREDEQAIRSTYRSLNRHLNLSIEPEGVEPYVKRFIMKLDFGKESRQLALRLARDAEEANLDSGMAPPTLAACLAYITSLHYGLGITQQDIREATGVGTKTMRNHYRDVARELEVPLRPREGMDVMERRDEAPTAANAKQRIADEFDAPPAILNRAKELFNDLEGRSGKSPAGLIGGAFWVALQQAGTDLNIKQTELAHHLGVSEATIQQRAREYREAGHEPGGGP